MKRRTFVKTTSAGLLAGMIFPSALLAGNPPAYPVGLQLYTLRNQVKDDLEGSLRKIAEIGYQTIETAGYGDGKFYGLAPADFKALVNKFGLKATSSHLTFRDDELPAVLQAHKEAGIDCLVWPWIGQDERASIGNYVKLAAKFNTIGKACKGNGLHFGYHNHAFEFDITDGKIPYDILLSETDPDAVFMQADLYWVTYAGQDPVAWFEKYPGRFRQWHVKDMKAGDDKKMTEVGTGIIDYARLFEYRELAGMKAFFIEQDVIEGDGFESVRTSYENMKQILQ